MSFYNVMITQANSQLGVALTRQLLSLPNAPEYIFALYTTEENVQALMSFQEASEHSRVILCKIDLKYSLEECVGDIKTEVEQLVGDRGIDLFINITCLQKEENNSTPLECLKKQFQEGTVTSLTLFQIMQPLLEDAAFRNMDRSEECKAIFFNVIEEKSLKCSNPVSEVSKVSLHLALSEMAAKACQKNILVLSTCLDLEEDTVCEEEIEKNAALYLLHIFGTFQSRTTDNLTECSVHQLG